MRKAGQGRSEPTILVEPACSLRREPHPSSDPFTPAERSAVMRRVKGRNTTPELRVRRLLRRLGFGYRLHRRDLPGSPDIAMAGRRLAIFVHGCFWHGHDCRRGARPPRANAAYWAAKIGRNRARDGETAAKLDAVGWRSLVIWECELKDELALEARLVEHLGGLRRRAPASFDPPIIRQRRATPGRSECCS